MYEEMISAFDLEKAFQEKEIEEALAYINYRKRLKKQAANRYARIVFEVYDEEHDFDDFVPSYDW